MSSSDEARQQQLRRRIEAMGRPAGPVGRSQAVRLATLQEMARRRYAAGSTRSSKTERALKSR